MDHLQLVLEGLHLQGIQYSLGSLDDLDLQSPLLALTLGDLEGQVSLESLYAV